MGSRQFPGQADLAALLWWHWGLPELYLPFHARPRSGVKRTEGSKERPAGQQLVSFTPAHSACYTPASHLPIVPATIHILVMLGTRHGSDPALPGPTLPQAVRGREMRGR